MLLEHHHRASHRAYFIALVARGYLGIHIARGELAHRPRQRAHRIANGPHHEGQQDGHRDGRRHDNGVGPLQHRLGAVARDPHRSRLRLPMRHRQGRDIAPQRREGCIGTAEIAGRDGRIADQVERVADLFGIHVGT